MEQDHGQLVNVIGIDSKRKPDAPCPYCGKKPACADFTCPRIKSIWSGPDGEWEIQFFDPRDSAPEPESE